MVTDAADRDVFTDGAIAAGTDLEDFVYAAFSIHT